MIDLFLYSMISLPPIRFLTSYLFFPDRSPNDVFQEIGFSTNDSFKSFSSFKSFLMSNELFQSYFIENNGLIFIALDQFIQLSIFLIILIFSWTKFGTSIGKYICLMKIVDDKTLQKPTIYQNIIRCLTYIPSALFAFLGFFSILYDKQSRAWHDKVSGTIVIKK